MCRQVLLNGSITVTAENGYQMLINFLEYGLPPANTSNHYVVTNKWDGTPASADPLADLEAARLATIKDSGIGPNVALFGNAAKNAFISNPNVKAYLDNRRYELGSIAPTIQSDVVVRFGLVPGMELYSYSEYFEDDAGTLFPMLPDPLVILLSTNVQNKIVYGAFTQLEDARAKRWVTYQNSRIPFVYGEEEDGVLFYRLTSCPLPMPADILGFRIIEAMTGGAGPFARDTGPEGEPYFEADQGVPEAEGTETGKSNKRTLKKKDEKED
jgi:Phage major capsid protein E.